jgi:hypothetical protein
MAEQVKVPGIGEMKRSYVITGVAGAAAYVTYRWWKAKSSAGAAAAATTADTTGAAGTDTTGAAATGDGSYTNPATYTGGASYNSGTASGSAPQSDEEWTAAVEQDLSNLGYDPQTVAEALAQYLASQQLSSTQVTIIRMAWAYEGRPPQHPNLPIIQQQSGGTSTPPPPPPPPGGGSTTPAGPAHDIRVSHFLPITTPMTWQQIAFNERVFGGSGNALYQYNLISNKHTPATLATFRKNGPGAKVGKGQVVAIPEKGIRIDLPGVGTVTS